MKTDWKKAPEQANWLAMDQSGDWYWYANKPLMNFEYNSWRTSGGMFWQAHSLKTNVDWKQSLEARPTKGGV